MKLYNSIGPNPRVVRMFLSEKGVTVPLEEVDIMGAANRQADYLEVNPAGQLPALELDDGAVVTEITAICEYFEETHPSPALIGSTPAERAETRMWTRRVDLNICEPMANGFRFAEGLQLFKDRIRCLPEAADGLKACARDKLQWLDRLMEGKSFIVGDRFSLADILLYSFADFGAQVGQPIDKENRNLTGWFERVGQRPSAQATA